MIKKKVNLILSGGGARGAYQAGVLKALNESGLYEFVTVSGTSAGALNGLVAATNDLNDIETLWLKKLPILKRLVGLPLAIKILVDKQIKKGIKKPYYFNFYSLHSDIEAVTEVSEYENSKELSKGVRASATIPLLHGMCKINSVKTKYFTFKDGVDGGVSQRVIKPVQNGYPHLLIDTQDDEHKAYTSKTPLGDLVRMVSILMRKKTKEVDYRIEPSVTINSRYSFNNKKLKQNFDIGYQDGLNFIKQNGSLL